MKWLVLCLALAGLSTSAFAAPQQPLLERNNDASLPFTRLTQNQCPSPKIMNAAGQCVCPPTAANIGCTNRSSCPPPMVMNSDHRCPPPQMMGRNGRCICPEGTMMMDGRCMRCPPPKRPNSDGRCVCPPGMRMNPLNGMCVKG